MAGSIKSFVYTDDAGDNWGIRLDESNTEAVNGGEGDITDTQTSTQSVPRNITVREVFYTNGARTRTIRCVPLTPDAYGVIIAGTSSQTIPDPIDSDEPPLKFVRANGETRRILFGIDTGLTDGDAT